MGFEALLTLAGPASAIATDRLITSTWFALRRRTNIWKTDPNSYAEGHTLPPIQLKLYDIGNEKLAARPLFALKSVAGLLLLSVGIAASLAEKHYNPISYACVSLGLGYLVGANIDDKKGQFNRDPIDEFSNPEDKRKWREYKENYKIPPR